MANTMHWAENTLTTPVSEAVWGNPTDVWRECVQSIIPWRNNLLGFEEALKLEYGSVAEWSKATGS